MLFQIQNDFQTYLILCCLREVQPEPMRRLNLLDRPKHTQSSQKLLTSFVIEQLNMLRVTGKGFEDDELYQNLGQIAVCADGQRRVKPSWSDQCLQQPAPPSVKNSRQHILNELIVFYEVNSRFDISFLNTFMKENCFEQSDEEKERKIKEVENNTTELDGTTGTGVSPLVCCDLRNNVSWGVFFNNTLYPCPDRDTAILASIQCCYVFNLAYNSRVRNTMDFLASVLFDFAPKHEKEWPIPVRGLRTSLVGVIASLAPVPDRKQSTLDRSIQGICARLEEHHPTQQKRTKMAKIPKKAAKGAEQTDEPPTKKIRQKKL